MFVVIDLEHYSVSLQLLYEHGQKGTDSVEYNLFQKPERVICIAAGDINLP